MPRDHRVPWHATFRSGRERERERTVNHKLIILFLKKTAPSLESHGKYSKKDFTWYHEYALRTGSMRILIIPAWGTREKARNGTWSLSKYVALFSKKVLALAFCDAGKKFMYLKKKNHKKQKQQAINQSIKRTIERGFNQLRNPHTSPFPCDNYPRWRTAPLQTTPYSYTCSLSSDEPAKRHAVPWCPSFAVQSPKTAAAVHTTYWGPKYAYGVDRHTDSTRPARRPEGTVQSIAGPFLEEPLSAAPSWSTCVWNWRGGRRCTGPAGRCRN